MVKWEKKPEKGHMIFLDKTPEFIKTVDVEFFSSPIPLIICGVIFVVGITTLLLAGGFNSEVLKNVGFGITLFAIVSGVFLLSSIAAMKVSGATDTSYDLPAFKKWASDTYMIDVNDEQAEELLANVVNAKQPYVGNGVYVEAFNGSDAIAVLYYDEVEWRLVITESMAVPSH